MILKWFFFSLLFLCSVFVTAQESDLLKFSGSANHQLVFLQHPGQKFGFDDFYLKSREELPNVVNGANDFKYVVPVKSVSNLSADLVLVHLKGKFDEIDLLSFQIESDSSYLHFERFNDSLVTLTLPSRSLNYDVIARYENEVFGKLKVLVYAEQIHNVTLVPICKFDLDPKVLEDKLNGLLSGANVKIKLAVAPIFQRDQFNDSTIFENPDTTGFLSYTDQMSDLIRQYERNSTRDQYKLFIIKEFKDSLMHGFMGIGNSTGFVASADVDNLAESILKQLAKGIGFMPTLKLQILSKNDTTSTLKLSYWDWEQFRAGKAGHTTWVEGAKVKRVGAVAAYYFWEENADGVINEQSMHFPYKRNYIVTVSNGNQKKVISSEKVEFAVSNLMDDNYAATQKSTFEIKTAEGELEKFHINLKKEITSDYGSVIFIQKEGKWETKVRKNVLYFNILNDSVRKFSYASDSIVLSKYNIVLPVDGHYVVKTYWRSNGKISKQEVFAYNGENVTQFFMHPEKMIPRRVLVFSNGYRGRARNRDISDNLVTTTDRYTYWLGIDKAFNKRLQPYETFYIDGNHDISTSGHRTMLKFGLSLAGVKTFARKNYYKVLNTKPNVEGFNERREKGKIAGKAFLIARCNSPACIETVDTVDIVCHSMGYAYALGFIESIKGKVIFGKMYIIAPENACVGGTDWSLFEEVWQYGSDLDQPNPSPVWKQDGIAPQCEVKGLETLPKGKGGRAFFPKDWPKQNFVDSHMLYSYFWMFECIKMGENGYIHK